MNKRGIALIVTFMVIVVLTILGSATISRSVSERFIAQRYAESTKAFWLAEAGVNCALKELRNNYNISEIDLSAACSADLGQGRYSIIGLEKQGIMRKVTSKGYVPLNRSTPTERTIEVIIGDIFYANAIYSAGDVDFNGNRYSVTGDVLYADEIEYQHENVDGSIIRDPSISPLEEMDFQQLRNISESQGNLYDEARIKRVKQGKDSFPSSFWYSPPTDPNDPATGTPNIVYVQGELELGNIGTIGGFFIVVDNEVEINGKGQIEGIIYTQDELSINGGGGNLNVNGGVWVGEEAGLNGNAHIAYNQDYMLAIKALLDKDVKIVYWKDTQNPYPLAP
jgi:hypothetical protein